MKDLADQYTRGGTSWLMIVNRVAFAVLFLFTGTTLLVPIFPESALAFTWLVYLFVIYLISEGIYYYFRQRNIDLTLGMHMMLAIYLLNLGSQFLGGQDKLTTMNRAEHFTSFVLLGYIVWTFFVKYLPHNVWHDHPYYTALLTLSVTSLLGVGNEIFELASDVTLGTKLIGENYDTARDLVMNTLGTSSFLSVRLILNTWEENKGRR